MMHVWVVEMLCDCYRTPKWEPTVGSALNKVDAWRLLKSWRGKNPSIKFRITKYLREPST